MGVEKIRCWCLIWLVLNRIHQVGGFEKLVVGAIDSLKMIQVVDSFSLVARERRSSPQSRCEGGRCDRDHHLCCSRLDLSFLQGHGRKAAIMSHPSDLADGEHETFGHGSGSWDDDHLVCLGSYTHTPYLARHYRRKLVGSLPWVYTHDSSLSADRCASYELDGDARHRQCFYLGSAAVWA